MNKKTVALIVAHPDDETLWAGGMMLGHPLWHWFVVSLCRGSDTERSEKFYNALQVLQSEGAIGDLDDGPEQIPLNGSLVEDAILDLLPSRRFDLIITHNPAGEYTKHLRHEETSKAVINLWHTGKLSADELWIFAYEDGNKAYYPKPMDNATFYYELTKQIWRQKYRVITKTYGFKKHSWEAQTTPKTEAFRQFIQSYDAIACLHKQEYKHESINTV